MQHRSQSRVSSPKSPDRDISAKKGFNSQGISTVETSRYCISVTFNGEPRVYAAILLRDEYEGWCEYHCTYRGGAMSLYLLQKGTRWMSKDRRFIVSEVKMLSRAEYCEELERICNGFSRVKAS